MESIKLKIEEKENKNNITQKEEKKEIQSLIQITKEGTFTILRGEKENEYLNEINKLRDIRYKKIIDIKDKVNNGSYKNLKKEELQKMFNMLPNKFNTDLFLIGINEKNLIDIKRKLYRKISSLKNLEIKKSKTKRSIKLKLLLKK